MPMCTIGRREPDHAPGKSNRWILGIFLLLLWSTAFAEDAPTEVDSEAVENAPADASPDTTDETPAEADEETPVEPEEESAEDATEEESQPLENTEETGEVAERFTPAVMSPNESVDVRATIAVERIDGLEATKEWRMKSTGAILRRIGKEGYRRVMRPKELRQALAGTEEEDATPCFRLECAIYKASLAGADYLIQGDVLTADGKQTLHLKLVDMATENVIREATDWVEKLDEADLPKLAAVVAIDLLQGRVASADSVKEVADYSDYNENPAYDITKWTTLGVGLAGIGTAVALGFLAQQKQDDYNDAWKTKRTIKSSLKDEADSLAMGTNIAYAVSGAILATSVTMFFIDGFNVGEYKPNPVQVGAWVAPGTVNATVRYEF